jgi:hypothetical protein
VTRDQSLVVRWIVPIVGTALGAGVLVLLYRGLEPAAFMSALAGADPLWLLALSAAIVIEQLVRGWKWRQILFDVKPVPALRLFGAVMAGYGSTILIPLGISPLVRSWLVARLESLPMATVLTTTAIERFLDAIVFAMFAVIAAMSLVLPQLEGNLRTGLFVAGGLNLVLFSVLLSILFGCQPHLGRDAWWLSRLVDWISLKGGRRLAGLRSAVRDGIVWPRERRRQAGAVLASIVMKIIATTHFLWAGLAVGIVLSAPDYLFLMVFAGFALVLARFVRVPGGFVIGSGLALKVLGVPDEQATAMIVFSTVATTVLMVGIGLSFLWRSGIDIRQSQHTAAP